MKRLLAALIATVSVTAVNGPPDLTNPGAQANAVTDRYGYAGTVLSAAPAGYWRLEDDGQASVTDWSTDPHAGAVSGGVVRDAAGALADGSTAMTFDGQPGSRVEIANNPAAAVSATVTVEAWVKPAMQSALGIVVQRTTNAGEAYRLMQLYGQWYFAAYGCSRASAVAPIDATDVGTWSHLVGTFDGTTARLYKNGVLVGSGGIYYCPGTFTIPTGSGALSIGDTVSPYYPFTGAIDDVAVYAAALSAGQISNHYALRTATSSVVLPLSATDVDGGPLSYHATGLPIGLILNQTTGAISGDPLVAGTYAVSVTATDPTGLSDTEAFDWTISAPPHSNPHRPALTNPGAQTSGVTDRYGYAGTVLSAAPAGYWRLEHDGQATVTDWSNDPHAGTVSGGVVRNAAGALADGSTAMTFDGQPGSHVEIAGNPAGAVNATVTVEAWVKPAAQSGLGIIVQRMTAGGEAYRLMHLYGQWYFAAYGCSRASAAAPVDANDVGTWSHLVGTFDGTTARLYKNGVLVGSGGIYYCPGTFTIPTGSGVLSIGDTASPYYPFAGAIDEVAVYAAPLSGGQVANHYALRTATNAFVLPLTASDADGDPLVFSATGLPIGLVLNPATGVISGDPMVAGTYTVTVTVTDPAGLSDTQAFSLTITPDAPANPHRPALTNPGPQSSALASGYAASVLSAGPAGYWRLEHDGQAAVTDWSNDPHPGSVTGGVVRNVAGALADGSTAMTFDGQPGSRVEVAGNPAGAVTATVTVEAWVKPAAQSGLGIIVQRMTSTGEAYRLMQLYGQWYFAAYGCSSASTVAAIESGDVGAWSHLVGTFDGTTARLYKNGTLVGSGGIYYCPGTFTIPAGSGVLSIGDTANPYYPFTGAIDEVAVYATALSASQVSEHYALRTAPSSITLQLAASDADGDPLTYSATGLPVGLVLNPATGIINGHPQIAGAYAVTAAVTDPAGLSATASFAWTVAASCGFSVTPPTLTSAAGGSTGTIAISTLSNCPWTISSSEPWIVFGSVSGVGSASVGYTIAANTGTARSAVVTAAGVNIAVSQDGVVNQGPPVVDSVSPTTGRAGTEVTLTGTGFGSSQGSGSVWIGTRAAVVTSWSDTAIVANVANGSTTGTAQVRRADAVSNQVPFTVITPEISGVTPSSGAVGTLMTISGTGFGATQGAGVVWLGSIAATVTTWSDTQVQATVPAAATSGNVQILQGGVLSNAVPFAVTGGAPHIDGIYPTAGTPGTTLYIGGRGFGDPRGSGLVQIGGAAATVTYWSDTFVQATVGATAISGAVKIQQNGLWSNGTHFTVRTANGSSLTLSPSVVNLTVGQLRSVQALDQNGASVEGLTWTSSDEAIVTISTDPSPVITAVAPGTAEIRAGNASMDVTVYAEGTMPDGTVLWSAPGPISGVADIKVAVPAPGSVADVFAIGGEGEIQAVTSDGVVAWTAPAPLGWNFDSRPDFQGGLVVFNPYSIVRLAPETGQLTTLYANANEETESYGLAIPAIHPDGKVLTVDYACHDFCGDADPEDSAAVVGIDVATGARAFRVPLANSIYIDTLQDSAFCQSSSGDGTHTFEYHPYPTNNLLTMAADGFAYFSYLTYHSNGSQRRAAQQPWPDEAYTLWDQMRLFAFQRNWASASSTLEALLVAIGDPNAFYGNLLRVDYQNQNYPSAVLHHNGWLPQFLRACDRSETLVIKLHLMRVNGEGQTSDVVVKEWTSTDETVHTLNPSTKTYTVVETHTGANDIDISENIITNADHGALYSWRTTSTCYENGTSGNRTHIQVDPCPATENHLTVTRDGAVTSDVVWQPGADLNQAVEPVLQLEDGLFAGQLRTDAGDTAIVFDSAGQIRWTIASFYPEYAVRGGGLAGYLGDVGVKVSADGTITATTEIPQFQSWRDNAYSLGSVALIEGRAAVMARTYWPQKQGNPSGTGAKPVDKLRFTPNPSDGPAGDLIGARLREIFTKFSNATDPATESCRAWLNPGQTSWTWQMPLYLDGHQYAHGRYETETVKNGQPVRTLNELTAASTNGSNPGESVAIGPSDTAFLVNDNGSFYKTAPQATGTVWLGPYGGNNPRSQVETLLHELAHLIRSSSMYPNLPDTFDSDFGDKQIGAAGAKNAKTLLKYCRPFIQSFPPQ